MATRVATDELRAWLLLNALPGFGPAKFKHLLTMTPSFAPLFNANRATEDLNDFLKAHRISPKFDWEGVEKELRWQDDSSHHIIALSHPDYPDRLKQIHDAPGLLYVKGNLSALKSDQMAIVGSRHPSVPGQKKAYEFAQSLAKTGLCITSGLAYGIDAMAAKGALSQHGQTIAVLGHGLSHLYPKSHHELANQIIEKGALVSEYRPHIGPKPAYFPKRNRIISGMSVGVLVVEATLKSGSLITAYTAMDQSREVFAMPGSIDSPVAKGCHQLIRDGAKCIDSMDHILEELTSILGGVVYSISKGHQNEPTPSPKEDASSIINTVLSHVAYECTPIDWVVSNSGLSTEQVAISLQELELQGDVALVPGGYVRV